MTYWMFHLDTLKNLEQIRIFANIEASLNNIIAICITLT